MRWPAGSGDEADQLVDGQRQDTEHQMAQDFVMASDADGPPAEVVLDPAVDPFGGGALVEPDVFGGGKTDSAAAAGFRLRFGLAARDRAGMGVDDRDMADGTAVRLDLGDVQGCSVLPMLP